jgi:hypothetical protein
MIRRILARLAMLAGHPRIPPMRTVPTALLALVAVVALATTSGCNARQDGDFYVQGSRAISGTFYAEYFNPENKRWYLLATQETLDSFKSGNHEMPMSKTLIGAGPAKETVVVEQVKDVDLSKTIGRRLTATFNERKGTSITAFEPK